LEGDVNSDQGQYHQFFCGGFTTQKCSSHTSYFLFGDVFSRRLDNLAWLQQFLEDDCGKRIDRGDRRVTI
jgi:hypothetical protein